MQKLSKKMAIQSMESCAVCHIMDCHTDKSARNDAVVGLSSLRDSACGIVAIHNQTQFQKEQR